MRPGTFRRLRVARRRVVAALAGGVILAVAATGLDGPAGPSIAVAAPQATPTSGAPTAADAARGLGVYGEHCASCHGASGRGDGPLVDRLPSPPPSLADAGRMNGRSPADLYATVTNGRLERGMPPFSRLLSDAERRDVVAAVRSFTELHPLTMAVGAAAWTRDCAACHAAVDAFAASIRPSAAAGAPAPDPGAGLSSMSLADLTARYDAVDAHRALTATARSSAAALAFLHAADVRPLALPGLAAGGRIEGRIVGGGGATPPSAGLTVSLGAAAAGLHLDWGSVPVDGKARFGASDLAVGEDVEYEPIVRYQGVAYRAAQAITLTAASPIRRDVVIHVFEADPAAPVRVAGVSGLAQADAARGELAVFEVWRIENASDRTRVATASAPTFHLPLPIGARDVILEDRTTRGDVAAASTAGANGLECRLPVPPGGLEIVASYAMPYRGTTATLQRTLPEGADQIGWVLADRGAVAASDRLAGPVADAFGDQPVTRYNGGPVAPGERWTIKVSALPAAAVVPGSAQDVLGPAPAPPVDQGYLAAAALAVGLAGVVAALWASRRGRSGSAAPGRRPARAYEATIAAITSLDERFERGEIARNEHQRRRGALVARALALRSAHGAGPVAAVETAGGAASEEG